MNVSWISAGVLFIPLAVAAVTVVGQIASSRLWPALGIYRTQLIGIALGVPVFGLLTWALWDVPAAGDRTLANAGIYLCFCYVYFHFNNMGETARRIRLLREMASATTPLTCPEILQRYGASEVLGRRMARLLEAGQVVQSGNRLFIANRSASAMVWAVNLVHRIVFGSHRSNPLEGK
jgi:hypothetical protein